MRSASAAHLRRVGVVGGREHRAAAGALDERRGLLERLGTVHRRSPPAGAAPGDVDGRAGGAQLDRDRTAASASGAGDDGDVVGEAHPAQYK